MQLAIAIVTVSDRSYRGEREDQSGPALKAEVEKAGWNALDVEIVPDEQSVIEEALTRLADAGDADVILTTGGTGVALRDVTPEATLSVITRQLPGMAEGMRAESLRITPNAMLSRAVAGTRGECVIINLPGSPKGAVECFGVVVPALEHAVLLLRGEFPDK